ncbi:MAG: LacI family DNA-binding transcriptional regulator [Bacteroidota bacterium]
MGAAMHTITMKDVAKKAGVSVSTVSRVLNNRCWVRPEVREHVWQVIREIGYQPNMAAQTLVKGGATRQIGLLVWDITSPYYAEIALGVEEAAYQAGYMVMLCNYLDFGRRDEDRYIEAFLRRRVDGVVVAMALSEAGIEKLGRLVKRGIKVAVCRERGWLRVDEDDYALELGLKAVDVDTRAGIRRSVDHLAALGHKRIGYLFGPPEIPGQPRIEAFKAALAERGLAYDDGLVVAGLGYRQAAGVRGMQELAAWRSGVTAVLAFNDLIALGAMSYCYEQGLSIPEDISLVGFDNIEQSVYTCPPLTTVNIPREEIGRELVRALLDTEEKRPQVQIVAPNLVLRGTTAFAPDIRQ